jgi:sec-independent protein translocase protein TatB
MFDITSSKLLILAIVALLVVGPKDLPLLLRTIGKYMGVIRRHAAEFRAQFDEAVRDTELEQLKQDLESVRHEMKSTIDEGAAAIDRDIESAKLNVQQAVDSEPSQTEAGAKSKAPPVAEPEPTQEKPAPKKTGTRAT